MNPFLYEFSRRRFSGAARSFGIGALVCSIFFGSAPFLPIGLGCMAILLAILSKGYNDKPDPFAKTGIYCSIAAIIISLSVSAMTLGRFMLDKNYRDEQIALFDTLYGDLYEETYGYDITSMINSYFEGK